MASTKEIRALITLAGKLDPSLQSAMLKATNQQKKFSENANKSGGALSKVGQIAKGVFVGSIMTRGVSLAINSIRNMSSQGIQLASSLSEVQNVVNTTFGGNSKQINDWSKTALNAFGLSELQAKQYTGTLGAMLKSSGVASEYSLKMSKDLAGLSGDFASFYNLDSETAFEKIRSGISGETEPLKQLGINMSVANLQAFALSKGIKTQYSNMDQASQTLLRYNYLMSVSKDSQGDFAKTLDTSYANQKRLFDTKMQETMAKIAVKTMPLLTKGLKFVNTLIDKIDIDRIGGGLEQLVGGVAGFLPNIMSMAGQLVPAISQLFPIIMSVASTAMPLFSQGLGLVMSVVTPLIPVIGKLVTALLPAISQIMPIIFAAITPLLPVFQMLISTLLPPVLQIISSLMPLLQNLGPVIAAIANVIGTVLYKAIQILTPVLEFFANLISKIVGGVGKVIGFLGDKISGLFGGKDLNVSANVSNLPKYAKGGFASTPSLFGDAGLEAAIPVKRTPRSLALLDKTAELLGVKKQGNGVNVIFSPTYNGTPTQEIKSEFSRQKEELREMIEEILRDGGRPSFG